MCRRRSWTGSWPDNLASTPPKLLSLQCFLHPEISFLGERLGRGKLNTVVHWERPLFRVERQMQLSWSSC